jgi:hypothetical protein
VCLLCRRCRLKAPTRRHGRSSCRSSHRSGQDSGHSSSHLLLLALLLHPRSGALPDNRPYPQAEPTYTAEQTAQAKASVCDAYQKEQRALDLAGARNGGDDPMAMLAVATAIRQVLDVGSRYLLAKLAEKPATPPDVTNAVRNLARLDLELTIGYLDGLSNSDPELQTSLKAGDQAALTVQRLCKP